MGIKTDRHRLLLYKSTFNFCFNCEFCPHHYCVINGFRCFAKPHHCIAPANHRNRNLMKVF